MMRSLAWTIILTAGALAAAAIVALVGYEYMQRMPTPERWCYDAGVGDACQSQD